LLFLILSSLFSCAGTHHLNESKSFHLIENVPFFPQQAHQCGPASLGGVLNYWGAIVTPEEITAEIYSASAKGTLNLDMVLYPQKKGLKANSYQGSIEDIKNKIDSGYPVIVLVDEGIWMVQQNHFMVVVGYDGKNIIANSGRKRLKRIPLKAFIKSWEKAKFWTLLITPQR
jgi:ABC-type bacteriocin/lantibiotic exporter with double-glycine peptidase domain